jgi:hypothetical protein
MAVYWFLDFFSRASSRLCPLARAAGGGALDAELLASFLIARVTLVRGSARGEAAAGLCTATFVSGGAGDATAGVGAGALAVRRGRAAAAEGGAAVDEEGTAAAGAGDDAAAARAGAAA